jgi:phage FluMu gp28-like protein
MFSLQKYFTPYQLRWKDDKSRLRLCVKGRQTGLSYVDSYDSVVKAATRGGKDVWIISRDEIQSRQSIRLCKKWARVLGHAAQDYGEQIFTAENGKPFKVRVLTFASGASVYALSSNPDAIVGKTGHVKLDEFAVHKDQRTLYSLAKPVIQWGGTLSIISTQRGAHTLFNQFINDIKHHGNPMGWSLHEIPIQKAVEEGLVERINTAAGTNYSRSEWLDLQRKECISEEQWLQEYCCIPADESAAFITHDLITAVEAPELKLMLHDQLLAYTRQNPACTLFAGVDIGRKNDLFVIDIGEKLGDVTHDRLRLELKDKSYSEMRFELYRLLRLPQLKRCCIDDTGIGNQMAEEAKAQFGWKVEPFRFTLASKEELAFGLRTDFQDRTIRLVRNDQLRSDLRALRKEVTISGNIRFLGESADSHCDRTWALALRQHAARYRKSIGSLLG